MPRKSKKVDALLDKNFVDIVEEHQATLALARQMRVNLEKAIKTDPLNEKHIKAFGMIGRLITNLVKEGRMLEESRSREVDDLSDAELQEELARLGLGGNE